MKKLLTDLLWIVVLIVASFIIYLASWWALAWGLTWSDTIIALYIFMGIPLLPTIAYVVALGMSCISIKTKFFIIVSELILAYFAINGVFAFWYSFASFDGGWKIALKVIFTLSYFGIFVISGMNLYKFQEDK